MFDFRLMNENPADWSGFRISAEGKLDYYCWIFYLTLQRISRSDDLRL